MSEDRTIVVGGRRAGKTMLVDAFEAGLLDKLSRKRQASHIAVLRQLSQMTRFSIFEATANEVIAKTMTELTLNGFIEIDTSPGYPWSNVKLTAKGRAHLGNPAAHPVVPA